MIFKTMQEQEREAYITGHTGMANIMAAAHDLELAEVEQENREWEKDEEIKTLNEQAKATDEKLSAANDEINDLRCYNDKLTAETDEMHELITRLTDDLNFERTR